MEKGMLSKRFICEHRSVPGIEGVERLIDTNMVRGLHRSKRQDIKVLYSFVNLKDQLMYSVLDAHDRQSVESFFSDMRIPLEGVMEVELQCEGKGNIIDLKAVREAA